MGKRGRTGKFFSAAKQRSWESRQSSYEERIGAKGSGTENVYTPRDGFWDEDFTEGEDSTFANGVEAGDALLNYLLSLHVSGKLSAKSLCVVSWYASRAGSLGDVKNFAFRPSAPTGHFQRHVDSALGVNMKHEMSWRYRVDIPGHHKHDVSRTVHESLVTLPHEALHKEISADPSILSRIDSME